MLRPNAGEDTFTDGGRKTTGRPTWEMVSSASEDILKVNKIESLTWGQFKAKVATALDVGTNVLKPFKGRLKDLIAKWYAEERESDEEDEGEEEEEEIKDKEADLPSDAMLAFREMARAMNLGPKPLIGLKQMNRKDAEDTLKNRLIDAGAQFKGSFPSAREIAQARRKTETVKDLDGIDLGNVLAGSRRRRRTENENATPSKKKRRSVDDGRVSGSVCSRHEESGRSSDDEDSEEEFQLSG